MAQLTQGAVLLTLCTTSSFSTGSPQSRPRRRQDSHPTRRVLPEEACVVDESLHTYHGRTRETRGLQPSASSASPSRFTGNTKNRDAPSSTAAPRLSILERRCAPPIAPIDVKAAQHSPRDPDHLWITLSPSSHGPHSPGALPRKSFTSWDAPPPQQVGHGPESSSVYSGDDTTKGVVGRKIPSKVNHQDLGLAFTQGSERQHGCLQDYSDWAKLCEEHVSPRGGDDGASKNQLLTDSRATKGTRERTHVYSPFTPFVATSESTRWGRKIMVGHNGWLERTDQTPVKRETTPKKGGILDSLKKIAREVVRECLARTLALSPVPWTWTPR